MGLNGAVSVAHTEPAARVVIIVCVIFRVTVGIMKGKEIICVCSTFISDFITITALVWTNSSMLQGLSAQLQGKRHLVFQIVGFLTEQQAWVNLRKKIIR